MELERMRFIKTSGASVEHGIPVYRKEFSIDEIDDSEVFICAPGGYVCYINGCCVGEDVLSSPISVWEKTLWVTRYDIRAFLQVGKNEIFVLCGNGFYNEGLESVWDLNQSSLRDQPKFCLQLCVGNEIVIESDDSWEYTWDSPIIYSELRAGEYVDFRKNIANSEVKWGKAVFDEKPPKGEYRLVDFPLVKECETLAVQNIKRLGKEQFFVDFGKNIAGYVELSANVPYGKEVKLTYCEKVNETYLPDFGKMATHYTNAEFQVDKLIGNGQPIVFKPKFTYHGFRYLIVDGLEELSGDHIKAYFIHQDIPQAIQFECSDKKLETLFHMAVNALLSNSVHLLTDCPTREKFGWLNDAMCSAETFMYLFDCKDFALKLLRDFVDAISDVGKMPCILPACSWGYHNCNGVFMDSVLFEFADKIYEIYGDSSGFELAYSACEKSLNYLRAMRLENGLYDNGLCDWAGPYKDFLNPPTPVMLSSSILMYKCLCIMAKAASVLDKTTDAMRYIDEAQVLKENIQAQYIDKDGFATIAEMPAVALLIAFDIYDDLQPLKQQLKEAVEEHDFHHYCGMISLRYLYTALDKCELSEYAYKIITAEGYPSYCHWIEQGETSLCETWRNQGSSRNHHLYSAFITWIIHTLCGFSLEKGEIKKTAPFDCVESFKLTYQKGAKKFSVMKDKDGVKYENH